MPNVASICLAVGLVLFVLGTVAKFISPFPMASQAATLGLVLTAAGGLLYIVNRRRASMASSVPSDAPLTPKRRWAAVSVLALGLLAFGIWFALPSVHEFSGFSDAKNSAARVAEASSQGWIAVRGPYYSVPPAFDALNETTYVIWGPGGDNHPDCFAMRISGDHRDFRSTSADMAMLLLAPHDVGPDLEPLPPFLQGTGASNNSTDGNGCKSVEVLSGTFATVTPQGHVLSFMSGMALVPIGLALFRRGAAWWWALASGIGALAGFGLVHSGLSNGGDQLWLMIGVPILLLPPLLIGVIGMARSGTKPRRFLVFGAFLAYSMAYILTFMAWVDFYPSPPFG